MGKKIRNILEYKMWNTAIKYMSHSYIQWPFFTKTEKMLSPQVIRLHVNYLLYSTLLLKHGHIIVWLNISIVYWRTKFRVNDSLVWSWFDFMVFNAIFNNIIFQFYWWWKPGYLDNTTDLPPTMTNFIK
jgi:hypothetical protein